MTTFRWIPAVVAIFIVCLSACGQVAGNIDLGDSQWLLVDMAGEPPLPGSRITIGFEDGQVRGHLGCNSFSGPYSLSGSALEFGLLMSTLMACVEDDLMQQESRMFELIGQVDEAQLIEGRLHLLLADGRSLIYEPME